MKWLNFHDWQSRQDSEPVFPQCWHRESKQAIRKFAGDLLWAFLTGMLGILAIAICILAAIIFAPQP